MALRQPLRQTRIFSKQVLNEFLKLLSLSYMLRFYKLYKVVKRHHGKRLLEKHGEVIKNNPDSDPKLCHQDKLSRSSTLIAVFVHSVRHAILPRRNPPTHRRVSPQNKRGIRRRAARGIFRSIKSSLTFFRPVIPKGQRESPALKVLTSQGKGASLGSK